jgi:hypothetical protein
MVFFVVPLIPKITVAVSTWPWGVTLPEVSKMTEANQTMPILIPEAEGEGFETAGQRYGRHGLK